MINRRVFPSEACNRKYYFSFLKIEDKENKTLTYHMNVKKGAEHSRVELIRSNLQINEQEPDDTMIGELVQKCSEILYPLKLNLTETGYISKIAGYEEVILRWRNKKRKLLPEYDDKYSLDLLERIGQLYENAEKLLSALKQDWFYSVFFLPVYQNYKENLYSLPYKFSVFPYGKRVYDIDCTLIEKENKKNEILLKGSDNAEGENILSGLYILNPDRSIHNIQLKFTFPLKKEEIEIQIQELEEKKPEYNANVILYDEEEKRKEKEEEKKFRGFFISEKKYEN